MNLIHGLEIVACSHEIKVHVYIKCENTAKYLIQIGWTLKCYIGGELNLQHIPGTTGTRRRLKSRHLSPAMSPLSSALGGGGCQMTGA